MARLAAYAYILVTNPGVPARNVKELVALAKAKPGTLNFDSSGNGSGSHLAGELFDLMAGVKMVHVPYRGINEALTDLVAGRVQLAFAGAPIALSHAKTGKLRALAVTGSNRIASAADAARALLHRMEQEGLLIGEDVRPAHGGKVTRIFRATGGTNPVPG